MQNNNALNYTSRLRIIDDIVAVRGRLKRLATGIARHDRSLGDELQRAAQSIGLNASEGAIARGKRRSHFFDVAIGSARESITCLRFAHSDGLVATEAAAKEIDNLDRIIATLYKLSHRKA